MVQKLHFGYKNSFAQQFYCVCVCVLLLNFAVNHHASHTLLCLYMSVFLLACLHLVLCVSVPSSLSLMLCLLFSLESLSFMKRGNFIHAYGSSSFLGGLEYIEYDLHLSAHLNLAFWSSSATQTSQQAEQRLR